MTVETTKRKSKFKIPSSFDKDYVGDSSSVAQRLRSLLREEMKKTGKRSEGQNIEELDYILKAVELINNNRGY